MSRPYESRGFSFRQKTEERRMSILRRRICTRCPNHLLKLLSGNQSVSLWTSLIFSDVDQAANRIGGKCFTHDATKERRIDRDSRISSEGDGASTSFIGHGMDIPRAPITETVTWNGPPCSDIGLSQRGRRNSTGPTFNRCDRNLSRSNSRGAGHMIPYDGEANFSDQSRLSGNSFRSPKW